MLPAFGFILSPGDSVNHVVILDALLTTVPSQSLLCVVEAINGYPDQHNSGWDKSLLLNYLMTTPVIRSPQFDVSEAFCRIIAHTTALHFAFSLSSLLVCVAITFFTPSLRAGGFKQLPHCSMRIVIYPWNRMCDSYSDWSAPSKYIRLETVRSPCCWIFFST